MAAPTAVCVTELSQVGEARRVATAMAGRLGLDETARGRVAIVVTEAATNLMRHGGGGEVLLGPLEPGRGVGLAVLALDKGPGMADVRRCMADGCSTAGTAGTGLGALSRLSDEFDIYSAPGVGTALLARLRSSAPPPDPAGSLDLGAVCLPKPGEAACGDAWSSAPPGRVMVADGLGHGPMAAEASAAAVRSFRRREAGGPADAVRAAHDALRGTRGAVIGVAEIDPGGRALRFAGVGNVGGAVLRRGASQSLVSHNGTVGHEVRKVQEFTYAWEPDSLLVLHSDGLATHWRFDKYPGLADRDPALIAGVLYRDFGRGRDDVTVVVARVAADGGAT